MQNNAHHQEVAPESLQRKHETHDPPIRWILLVAGLVALTTWVCLGVVWVMMDTYTQSRPTPPSKELGVIAAPSLAPLQRFPAPNLQLRPHEDLLALTARQEKELTTYGWLDRTAGVVRLPIARAMDLVVQRGLPAQGTNSPPRTGKSNLELIRQRPDQR